MREFIERGKARPDAATEAAVYPPETVTSVEQGAFGVGWYALR